MIIRKAEFKCSSSKMSQCPEEEMREFAFIGRSNVGKSSLINMLTGRNSLAKVSGTPGKTKLINHFIINDEWALVDLPGYGYARTSKAAREEFSSLIRFYVTKRENLHCLFVLIDSRLEPQKIDLSFLDFLGENGIPFAIAFTKADKLSQAQINRNIKAFKTKLLEKWEELPACFVTSSETAKGKEELLDFISEMLITPVP
ncbi:GTP-binding protein EngB [Mucinivorans hirudinis]|uniref:Probable GTP-binding protein EngB n=1 Tax=Mucinivorans hirudinis TaxID=1433126 RepID=A0A060RBT6_9BACT|nr:GTP-binding protein EngB [Mucinivorans hirudinis]